MTDRTKLPLVSYANGVSSGGVFYPYQAKDVFASVALACTSPNQRIFLHTVSFMVSSNGGAAQMYDVSIVGYCSDSLQSTVLARAWSPGVPSGTPSSVTSHDMFVDVLLDIGTSVTIGQQGTGNHSAVLVYAVIDDLMG